MSLEEAMLDLVDSAIKSQLDRMHICTPAVIRSYNSSENLATVQLVSSRFISGVKSLPVIENVPISFPVTDYAGFSFRVKSGDSVLVHFCDVDITSWVFQGKSSFAKSRRRFNMNDCYATVGARPSGGNILTDGNNAEIFAGDSKIEFKESGSVIINNHLEVKNG